MDDGPTDNPGFSRRRFFLDIVGSAAIGLFRRRNRYGKPSPCLDLDWSGSKGKYAESRLLRVSDDRGDPSHKSGGLDIGNTKGRRGPRCGVAS